MPRFQINRFAIFILAAMLFFVFDASALDYSVSGSLEFLTEDSEERWNTEISDENVVWVQNLGSSRGLYLHNIKSGRESLVSKSRFSEFLPSVSGDIIVWSAKSGFNSPSQVISYNISSGRYDYLSYYPANQGMACVSGDYVVWLDGRYFGFTNIFLKNLATGGSGLFWESKTSDKKSPKVEGKDIYWVEKGTLFKRPVTGGEPLAVYENMKGDYSLSGDKIAWEERDGDYYSVALFDEERGKKIILSEKSVSLRNPVVFGDIIIYEKHKGGDSDIFLYDYLTGATASVYKGSGMQTDPKISGDTIIWTDRTGGLSNIASFKLDRAASPKADFRASDNSVLDGLPPVSVSFMGWSSITAGSLQQYEWDFGDGSTSKEASPVHTYTKPGTYNVTLSVKNDFGTDVVRKDSYITVGELPYADFTVEGAKGVLPYTTRFYDASLGVIDKRMWDFGDGTGSVITNPYHLYNDAGVFTVSLTVSNRYGSVTETKENLVDVGGAPDAAFVYSYAEGSTKEKPVVAFIDMSSGNPDSWLWYFGDGTFSSEQNPVHKFEKPGIYDVSLKVANAYAEDIKTEWGIIQADFSEYELEKIITVPNEAGLNPGDTMQFVAAAKDATGQSRLIVPQWKVSDESVASIDSFGVLTAKKPGSVDVICEFMGIAGVSHVAVGDDIYARSSERPALLMPGIPGNISEETKKLIGIFYRGSD
ncbi:MAG: PKD domain-containing protein [Methanomicrobium sp.]|nr:PKD domain-containing protein [Methanomicrobium sp.]